MAPPPPEPFECDVSDAPFGDVPESSFAHEPVDCIYNLGVTTGTSPVTYSPDNAVTREQMAAFMRRLYEAMTDDACTIAPTPFTDTAGPFAEDDIGCIFGLDVTTGTSATTYSPTDIVTRGQMAAFLARFYEADPPA